MVWHGLVHDGWVGVLHPIRWQRQASLLGLAQNINKLILCTRTHSLGKLEDVAIKEIPEFRLLGVVPVF